MHFITAFNFLLHLLLKYFYRITGKNSVTLDKAETMDDEQKVCPGNSLCATDSFMLSPSPNVTIGSLETWKVGGSVTIGFLFEALSLCAAVKV